MKKIFLTTLIFLLCVPLFSFSAYAAEYPIIYNPQHIQIFNYDESSDLDTGLEFTRALSLNKFKYVAALRSDVGDYGNWQDLSKSIFTKGTINPFPQNVLVSVYPIPSSDLFPYVVYGSIDTSSVIRPCLVNIPIGLQLSVSPDSSSYDGYIGLSFSFVTTNFIFNDSSDNFIDYFFQEYGACTAYSSSSPLNLLYSLGTPIKLNRQIVTKSVLYPANSTVGMNRYLYNVSVTLDMKYSDLINSSSSSYVTFLMNIPYNLNDTNNSSSFRFYANIPDTYKLYSLDSIDSSLNYIESQLESLNIINNDLFDLLSDIQSSDLINIISTLDGIYASLDHLDFIVRNNIYPVIDQIETILNTSVANESTIISLLNDLKSSIGNQNTELIHYFNTVDPSDQDSLDNFDDSVSNLSNNVVNKYDDAQTRIENIVNNVTLPSVQSDVSNVLNRAPDVVERIGNVFTNSYFTAALVIVFGFCAINLILYGISKGD